MGHECTKYGGSRCAKSGFLANQAHRGATCETFDIREFEGFSFVDGLTRLYTGQRALEDLGLYYNAHFHGRVLTNFYVFAS